MAQDAFELFRTQHHCPSDKFVALASIAELFQSSLKDQYVAGLWSRTLLYDLLWKVWAPMGPDEQHLSRPTEYRAPTWSWASVDGKLDLSYSFPPPSAACYEARHPGVLRDTKSQHTSFRRNHSGDIDAEGKSPTSDAGWE